MTDPKRPYEVKAEEIDSLIDKQMAYFSFRGLDATGQEMK